MILELKNIYKTYQQGKMDVPVLKNISMDIEKGDYVAIMGPSGSGKTTLMNLIGCLDYPSSGEYFLDGENVLLGNDSKLSDVRLNSIGFVFQSFHLLPRQSALENVALPLLYAGIKKKERLEIARYALGRVGLADRTDFKPTQLSGGQCQRVAIARAIVNNPKILLADEPTGALDTASGEQIMELFESLNRDGVTVIMITHEREIAQHANTIFYIRDGRLVDQNGQFIQSAPDPSGFSGNMENILQEQNTAMPEASIDNPQPPREADKPESSIPDTLPPAAQPETKIQESRPQRIVRTPRAPLKNTVSNVLPVAAPKKIHVQERTVPTEKPAVVQKGEAAKPVMAKQSVAATASKHPVFSAAPVQAPVAAQAPQSAPVTRSYDDITERERLLRMDVDALLSRAIESARQTEPEKPAVIAAKAVSSEKRAVPAVKAAPAKEQTPVAKPIPAPRSAASLKPAPVSKPAPAEPKPAAQPAPQRRPAPVKKPAPAGGAWSGPMGNPAPVFAFEKDGQFNRPIRIDLKNTDMGGSPWLFSTRGE